MTFTNLTEILAQKGLNEPDLICLHPDINHYTTLLLQPGGAGCSVEIRRDYFGPGTNQVIRNQLVDFFRNATEKQVNLAVVPEYCCPLQTIQDAIQSNNLPANRNLWIVGVESVTILQLTQFKEALGPTVQVVWEDGLQTPQGKFLDPVFYVFQSTNSIGEQNLVIVVQFKTEPMADFAEIERTQLVCGNVIYVFNQGNTNKQKLTTLICSDTLANEVQTKITEVHDRCLIVHIQLNSNPRESVFKRYRDIVFAQASDQTEIICLNWSTEIQSNPPGAFNSRTACGSAIYLKSSHVERPENDRLIRQNHRLGLYTTFCPIKHTFCFFFNYLSAVYYYNISKAYQRGQAVQARRHGPEMLTTHIWDVANSRWAETQEMPDNFSTICSDIDEQGLQHLHTPEYDPMNTERLVNLSIGFARDDNWFYISKLRTCQIDANERICRLTFAQERDNEITQQRAANLCQFNNLRRIIEQREPWPIWMVHIKHDMELDYKPEHPYRNLFAQDNYTATGIYFGSHSATQLAELHSSLEEMLAKETIRRQGQNAITIWFHKDGVDKIYNDHVRPKITGVNTEHSAEIDRSPDND